MPHNMAATDTTIDSVKFRDITAFYVGVPTWLAKGNILFLNEPQ